jgi:hypothetical protein
VPAFGAVISSYCEQRGIALTGSRRRRRVFAAGWWLTVAACQRRMTAPTTSAAQCHPQPGGEAEMCARRVALSLILLLCCCLCLDFADPCWGEPASLDGRIARLASRRGGREADLTGNIPDSDTRRVLRAHRPAHPPARGLTVVPLAPPLRPLLGTRAPCPRLGRRGVLARTRAHDPGEAAEPAGSASVPPPAFRPLRTAADGPSVRPPICRIP